MNHQLSIYDYLNKPTNPRIRQDVLVSLLTPAGIDDVSVPGTVWLKDRRRCGFNRKKLLYDSAGHVYVIQKVYKRIQHFDRKPVQLYISEKSLVDLLSPTVDSIIRKLNEENRGN